MARRGLVLPAAVLAALVLGGCGLLDGPAATRDRPSDATTDPASGLPWVEKADLPAGAADTLALIDAGGPFPYDEDDRTFFNRERLLPEQSEGYYREYTVKTPGEYDRGARRIVTGGDGEYYWTSDHYASFERIAR